MKYSTAFKNKMIQKMSSLGEAFRRDAVQGNRRIGVFMLNYTN